jgi:hypothetical protein
VKSLPSSVFVTFRTTKSAGRLRFGASREVLNRSFAFIHTHPGERRRCSIAVQLLNDPSLLFADEPTSGSCELIVAELTLQVSTASMPYTSCRHSPILPRAAAQFDAFLFLSLNAVQVICTLHQPRSDIVRLFDLVMILAEGSTVYFGPARTMTDYFASLGMHHSILDVLMCRVSRLDAVKSM